MSCSTLRASHAKTLTKSLTKCSAWSQDITFAALLLQYYKQTLALTQNENPTPTLTLTPTPTLTLTINGAFFLDYPSTGHVTKQKQFFDHNSSGLHFYPMSWGQGWFGISVEKYTGYVLDSTVLIPIYSYLNNYKFLLASDLVMAISIWSRTTLPTCIRTHQIFR